MKFLTVPELQRATSILDGFDRGDMIINGKIEVYSCKMAGDDKRISKSLERVLVEEAKKQEPVVCYTPLGPLTEASTRKLLINLICTLNASFPDYDFSDLRPDHFQNEQHTSANLTNVINTTILDPIETQVPNFRSHFWNALDAVIDMNACEVYSYLPPDDDDLRLGNLWAVNYFWFNKQEKKVALLSASATSKLRSPLPSGMGIHGGEVDGMDGMDAMDDDYMVPRTPPSNYPDMRGVEEEQEEQEEQESGSLGGGESHCVVDVGMLDWDDLGMVEKDLPESKWMTTEQKSVMGAPTPNPINLQAVTSPVIQPVMSPQLTGQNKRSHSLTYTDPVLPLTLD